jgi:hypothetical protein
MGDMSGTLTIKPEWLSADHGPPEVRSTSALLSIVIGDGIATRAEDDWSGSVHPWVRLSAYPLALWFAGSWWRLLSEPAPESTRRSLSWRMAHEATTAGGGFLWPSLAFEPDGENVEVICRASSAASTEPVRYLSTFRKLVPVGEFERATEEFINLTIQRLNRDGIRDTALHSLWTEVQEERKAPALANYRRLEAILGYEPGEGPEGVARDLEHLGAEIGEGAMLQLASACAGENAASSLNLVRDFSKTHGVEGHIVPTAALRALDVLRWTNAPQKQAPWRRGWELAEAAREVWNLRPEPLDDRKLSELLGMEPKALVESTTPAQNALVSLAIRRRSADEVTLLFRKRNRPGRRFEAARLLADHLIAPSTDRWLTATDAKTARQKIQRAFAAEFVCPIAWLQAELGGNFSNEAIEDAAERSGVSPLAVRSHLANNGLISPEEVTIGEVTVAA